MIGKSRRISLFVAAAHPGRIKFPIRQGLALAIAGATVAFTITAQAASLQLQRSIPNPSPDSSDLFGQGVAISGGVALVGATTDGTTGTGSGQAYLFNAATGALLHTLPNPGTAPTDDDHFGLSVSLAGNLALVGAQNDDTGATNSGQAYLFNASTGALLRTFANPSPAASDNFGQDVAIDNGRALISAIGDDTGASNAGVAYLFDTTTGALLQTFTNPVPGPTSSDNFGYAVALFGNRALISTINDDTAAMNAGAAYLFDTTTGALLRTFLNPTPELNNTFGNNDNYGRDVALSATKALVGASNENVNGFHNGAAYLYEIATGALLNTLLMPTPLNSDPEEFFGSAVSLSEDYALVGAPFRNKGPALSQRDLGAAFLFDHDTGAFLQELNDPSPVNGDRFGYAVALDGDQAMIGAQTDLIGTIRPGQVFYYSPVPEPGTLALLGLGQSLFCFGGLQPVARARGLMETANPLLAPRAAIQVVFVAQCGRMWHNRDGDSTSFLGHPTVAGVGW